MGDNSELTARITDKTKTLTLTPAEIKKEAADKNILKLLMAAEIKIWEDTKCSALWTKKNGWTWACMWDHPAM